MCGIAGLVGGSWDDPRQVVSRMLDQAAHRGPDGRGLLLRESVALGHVRLAIVDLSHDADQPMSTQDASAAIVFNGQIYNHRELRPELEQAGWRFRTSSDTEVLLASYMTWGRDCLVRFNGMWAFAVADFRRRRVFCARDRFGVKPFLFAQTAAGFAFASEAKQLLDLLPSRSPDMDRVAEFALTGLLDHRDRGCFAGIRSLGAGEWIEFDFDGKVTDRARWYSLAEAAGRRAESSEEEFAALFDDAVRLRLRADVTVGACLSGGLDSSSVVASAGPEFARHSGKRMHAVTASSEDPLNDERDLAQQVVQAVGLEWTVVRPTFDDFASVWDKLHWHQDEPVGGPSLVMQWHVMKAAREAGLVVMLDGQGGDETLLGYDRYWPALLAAEWRAHGIGAAVSSTRGVLRRNALMSLRRLALYAVGGRAAGMRRAVYRARTGLRADVSSEALDRYARNAFDPLALSVTEIEQTSLPALLRYEDRNSMAHGVEARLPFLDYRLVEAALRLPIRARCRDGWTKWPLRNQLGTRLPESIRWRRTKLGFNAPDRLWLPKAGAIIQRDVSQSRIVRELFGRRNPDLQSLGSHANWRLASIACWERVFRL
jgi:asparagine synthase (glutamine-hydrolysing)